METLDSMINKFNDKYIEVFYNFINILSEMFYEEKLIANKYTPIKELPLLLNKNAGLLNDLTIKFLLRGDSPETSKLFYKKVEELVSLNISNIPPLQRYDEVEYLKGSLDIIYLFFLRLEDPKAEVVQDWLTLPV